MSAEAWKAERLRLPNGREVVLGWAETGPEEDATLSALEREELARCRTDKRRREFVAGRLAAHRALALLEPGLRAEVTARQDGADAGRPLFVPERGLALSISHSAGLAVAGVARGGPLGVDLEQRVEAGAAFLEEAFAPGEYEGYLALCAGRMDAVTAAWALKEAVLKVWGVGLRAPLQKVAVRPVLLHTDEGRPDQVGKVPPGVRPGRGTRHLPVTFRPNWSDHRTSRGENAPGASPLTGTSPPGLALRVSLEIAGGLPPGLGEPPSMLAALLVAGPGRVLAVAG